MSQLAKTVHFAADPASVPQEAAGARKTSEVLMRARDDMHEEGAGIATAIAKHGILHADDVKALLNELHELESRPFLDIWRRRVSGTEQGID